MLSSDSWSHDHRRSGLLHAARRIVTRRVILILLACVGALMVLYAPLSSSISLGQQSLSLSRYYSSQLAVPTGGRTLLLYAYYEGGDAEVRTNLEFFLRVGIQEAQAARGGDLVDTILILNGPCTVAIPSLPNLTTLKREQNVCFDIGAYHQALQSLGPSRLAQYAYFIFINSSLRGPFLPVYLRPRVPSSLPTGASSSSASSSGLLASPPHWSAGFTSLIDDQVKWVGSTINCAQQAHVQTPIVATDPVGLAVLRQAKIFSCPADFPTAIRTWEIGSSAAMFAAGFNIASLQTRYRGLDFRRDRHANCNLGFNPASFHSADGFDLAPFEVMFVKAKAAVRLPNADMTRRYADYMLGRDVDVTTNEFTAPRVQSAIKAGIVAEQEEARRCARTFDEQYYFDKNKDLQFMKVGSGELTAHYTSFGAGEQRPHRFVRDPKAAATTTTTPLPADCESAAP